MLVSLEEQPSADLLVSAEGLPGQATALVRFPTTLSFVRSQTESVVAIVGALAELGGEPIPTLTDLTRACGGSTLDAVAEWTLEATRESAIGFANADAVTFSDGADGIAITTSGALG